MTFERALAHGNALCDRRDGDLPLRGANELDRCMDGGGGYRLWIEVVQQKALADSELLLRGRRVRDLILQAVHQRGRKDRVERKRAVVEQVDAVAEQRRGSDLGEAHDEDGRAH